MRYKEIINKIIADKVSKEKLPVSVKIGDNKYEVFLINGDEYTIFKNGVKIYGTSDAVGPYALLELFMAMRNDWAKVIEKEIAGRKNPGDLIDEITLEVILQYIIKASQVVSKKDKEKLKSILENVTRRKWNVREV